MEKIYKVLVVDDNSIESDLVLELMNNGYEVTETESSDIAIEMLGYDYSIYDIVIIKVKSATSPLFAVQDYLYTKTATISIPLVVVAYDDFENVIDRCIEKKTTDCFCMPIHKKLFLYVLSRILYGRNKFSNNYEDSMRVLSNIYYKIIKINLTNGSFSLIGKGTKKNYMAPESIKDFSEWVSFYANSDDINDEDKQNFMNFFEIENMRRCFREGSKYENFHYRRKVGYQYRWASAEIFPCVDYSPEEECVLLFIKDVHSEYLNHFEGFDIIEDGRVYNFRFNLISDRCNDITVDEALDKVITNIPDETGKERFKNIFSRNNLILSDERGRNKISLEHRYVCRDGSKRRVKTTVEIIKNMITGELEAFMYGLDITENYINSRIPEFLYDKEYDTICFIDCQREMVYSRKRPSNNDMILSPDGIKYSEVINQAKDFLIPEDEIEVFLDNSNLHKIVSNLEKHGRYDFSTYQKENSGEMRLKKYSYEYFDKKDQVIIATVEDVTEIAEKDILTGGINRRGFIRQVEQTLKRNVSKRYAIMYYNLRHFKAVNEMFGIDGGDELLKQASRNLRDSILKPIFIGRFEADHFVCLIDIDNLQFEEILRLCRGSFYRKGKTFAISAKCGIYYTDTEPGLNVSTMCDRARLAKQFIKDEYVKPYAIYEKAMNYDFMDKAEIISEVHRAIDEGEFKVFYQPVYDAVTEKVVSAEALIRWKHPERGIVSPGSFIPVLEESGYISLLDYYIHKKVKLFLEERFKKNMHIVPVSVNLSWMDFYDDKMINSIFNEIEESILDSDFRRFEVTETSYAALSQNDNGTLKRMKEMGVKLLLDDFGSGYSSFSTLKDYDFDIIKLDMGFVQKIGINKKVESIIRSIIDMAHDMNAKIIAEGAETKAQVEFLRENHCDYIQGFYYSRPIPEEEFYKMLNNSSKPVA